MDKLIEIRNLVATTFTPPQEGQFKNTAPFFDDLLDKALPKSTPENSETEKLTTPGQVDRKSPSLKEPILLGTISNRHPTVSDLLLNKNKFGKQGWQIIYSEINKNKPYTKIPTGTPIYLDPVNNSLNWPSNQGGLQEKPSNIANSSDYAKDKLQAMSSAFNLQRPLPGENDKLSIGIISKKTPTVSHLLHNNPQLRGDTWSLLSQPVNRAKSFHKLLPGNEIFLNRSSLEITWSSEVPTPNRDSPLPAAPEVVSNLRDAVQPFMGKPYKEIDCYTLLVHGLRQMGIPYSGKNGLYGRLTQMAKEKGLPSNAYLNGEGIVEATGKRVLSESFIRVNNWPKEADKIFRRMEPHLEKGQILSFSTPTRGHTGIVSQHDEQWTFINSGNMDNHVDQPTSPKEVGEENLISEIVNWFKLANRNRESLQVTLGQLEEEKIRSVFDPDFRFPKRL